MQNDTAPAWDGVPLNPERDGAHWIIGWNNSPFVAEWEADPNAEFGGDWGWYDGGDRPDGVAANGWTYGGPCLTPQEVAAREAAAWAAGAEAMREMAAGDADCGCGDTRDAVLARLESQGHKRASYLCPNGDVCCALQAESIRALPLPPMPGRPQGGGDA